MYVYKITLPNNKFYIGSTSNLEKRMREHKSASKTKKGFQKITDEISKFIFNDIKFDIIHECKTRKDAYFLESEEINKNKENSFLLNSFDRPETWYLTQKEKGKKKSKEYMENLRKIAFSNPETIKKMSEKAKKRMTKERATYLHKLSIESRIKKNLTVFIYDKKNNLIASGKSTKELSNIIGVNQTSFCRYISGERKCKNYIIEVQSGS